MLGRNGGDSACRLPALKSLVDLVQTRAQHESLGAHAPHVVKRVAECAFADAGHTAQILDWNRVATVFVQCRSMHRARGPEEMRPVGETEFVNGVAAMGAIALAYTPQASADLGGTITFTEPAQALGGGKNSQPAAISHDDQLSFTTSAVTIPNIP